MVYNDGCTIRVQRYVSPLSGNGKDDGYGLNKDPSLVIYDLCVIKLIAIN